jgi:transcription elongation factor GreA
VDFKNKPGHKMSVQMALSSLVPISVDHLYVKEYENFDDMKSIFTNDPIEFFRILLKSYSGEIKVNDIKYEVVPE